jgi:uncharacterized protein YqgC (DUF456 family)
MTGLVSLLLLGVVFLVGLILIPIGLPGLWLMVLALAVYAVVTGFQAVGWGTLIFVVVLAGLAEGAEAWLGFKVAKRFGGSNRSAWGAVAGGLIGAIMGTPVPIIGNVVGAFLGAFIGAVLMELSAGKQFRDTLGAGWGAILGRAAGAAVKITVGLVIAIIGIFAVIA